MNDDTGTIRTWTNCERLAKRLGLQLDIQGQGNFIVVKNGSKFLFSSTSIECVKAYLTGHYDAEGDES